MTKKPSLLKQLLVTLALGFPLAVLPIRFAESVVSNQATETITSLGNGATVNYTIGFTFQSNADVHVYREEQSVTPYTRTEIIQGSGASKFTISGGDPGTTVHMGTAPTTTQRLIIQRRMAYTQTVNYVETSAFPAASHEAAMDKMTLLLQQLEAELDSKIGLSSSSTSTSPTFPDPTSDRFLVYNHAGTDLSLVPSGASSLVTGEVLKYDGSAWSLYDLDGALSTLTTGLANHIADTTNPHAVTATQVGKDTAQWNANKIKSVTVDDTAKADGYVLKYNSGTGNLEYTPPVAVPPLSSAHLFVGNGSSVATDVAVSGDIGLANTGAMTVNTVGTSTASNVHAAEVLANAATASKTNGAIVLRNGSGAASLDVTGNLIGNVTGAVTGNASTASALLSNPADCAAGNLANVIGANGDLSCVQVTDSYVATGAAIARSKIASGTNNHVIINDGSGVLSSEAQLAVSRGGTGQSTLISNATASTVMARDANANARLNSLIENFATTATAAGTTTLTVSSSKAQQFTGTTTQTVVLPDATTLVVGQSFVISNRSTGVVTVNANGGGLVQAMVAGAQAILTVTSIGTSAGVWDVQYNSGTVPLVAAQAKSSSYTFASTDDTVLWTTSTSALTGTLPTAVGISGKRYTFVKVDTGTGSVAVATTSAQTVGGVASGVILLSTVNDTMTVESDGANWKIVTFNVAVVFNATATGQTNQGLGGTTAFTLTSATDTQAGFNGSNTYTIRIPGSYTITWMADAATSAVAGSSATNAVMNGNILVGGAITKTMSVRNQATGNFNNWACPVTYINTFAAGTTITVNMTTNFTTAGTGGGGTLNIVRNN